MKKSRISPLVLAIALVAALFAVASSDTGTDTSSGDSGASSESEGASDGEEPSEGSEESGEADAGASDEVDDVTVASCGADDTLGFPKATLTVVNDSEKASDYFIEVTFESADGSVQIGTGNAVISNLAPGQTKNEEVVGFEEAAGEFTCTVSSVERMESL